jgi:hypothetical protein
MCISFSNVINIKARRRYSRTHAGLDEHMNETTAILFELRALAEQIDQLECQARRNGAGASEARLTDLRSQTEALRSAMEQARRSRADAGHPARRGKSGLDSTLNYSRGPLQPSRAAAIVARLGVPQDRLFEALHAIGPLSA